MGNKNENMDCCFVRKSDLFIMKIDEDNKVMNETQMC